MIGTVFIKRGAAVGVSALLLITTTVSAQGDRLVSSNGRYSVNPENGSILIDTDDIEANAQAIARLQGQLGGLSFKYATEKDATGTGDDNKSYYWSLDPDDPTGEKWVKVGAVGSAVSSDVLVGKKFSSEAGVDIEGSMPNPTSANISATTNPTTNLSVGSETVTINNGIDTMEAHDTDVTQINLGVGEQITIPHGYYNKDIVISNGVSNKGSLTSTSTDNGYYIDIASGLQESYKNGYDKGVVDGTASSAGSTAAKVTYTINHTHVASCKAKPYILSSDGAAWDEGNGRDTYASWDIVCGACRRTFNGQGNIGEVEKEHAKNVVRRYAEEKYYAHIDAYGNCPYALNSCGYNAGIRTETGNPRLIGGDTVISAVINF